MIFDWIAREGWIVFNWWVLVSLAGLAVLPLMLRLLGGLPDRGYTLARPAGILLTGFGFWLLTSLGFINNSAGSITLVWFIVLIISLLVYFRVSAEFDYQAWWQENRKLVIVTEILFLVLLVGWAIFKAYRNDIAGTEKPMDLAFMSAINRSQTFPPNDPWLSDYSISYYYFGYLMASMLSTMSGITTTIGYNMHVAMLFALTGLAAFGVTYNLVRSRAFRIQDGVRTLLDKAPFQNIALGVGCLGLVFVIFLGNFQLPFVELPYQTSLASEDYLQFWDLQNRLEPIPPVIADDPATAEDETVIRSGALEAWDYWWWFRSARAIRDHNLIQAEDLEDPATFDVDEHSHVEVIAEFPQFSFLLSDSHPHVMALPYVLLAMGLALNLLLFNQTPDIIRVLFYGICVGALVFLNTWDAPIYIGLMVGADGVRRLRANQGQLFTNDWLQLFVLAVALVGIMIVAYFPFLVGFRSQLGGIIPNIVYPTKTQHLFLVFGPFFVLLPMFLGIEVWRARRNERMNWTFGLQIAVGILLLLALALVLFAGFAWLNPAIRNSVLRYIDAAGGWDAVMPIALSRRLGAILTPLILLLALVVTVGVLFPKINRDASHRRATEDENTPNRFYANATGFAILMIGVGVMLVLIPEFVYLRDNFTWRMNTIFKFYYQAWILFSIAGAYGVYTILFDNQSERPANIVTYAYSGLLAFTLISGLLFAVFGINARVFVEGGMARTDDGGLTLDGGRTVAGVSISDYQVLQCFMERVTDDDIVLVEAVGNSYDQQTAGRTGAITGIPTVIGWQLHESQWRGTSYGATVGSRPFDIERLYTDLRFDVVEEILDRYSIDYIMYGRAERLKYGDVGEEKFMENLTVFCESDTQFGVSRIYEVNSN